MWAGSLGRFHWLLRAVGAPLVKSGSHPSYMADKCEYLMLSEIRDLVIKWVLERSGAIYMIWPDAKRGFLTYTLTSKGARKDSVVCSRNGLTSSLPAALNIAAYRFNRISARQHSELR